MSSTQWLYGIMRIVIGCMLVLSLAARAGADPKPLTKDEQAKIDKAIEKGVAFLKRAQLRSGAFPSNPDLNKPSRGSPRRPYLLGETVLPALALLECGVPPKDPSIQKVAALVRKNVRKVDKTYEFALVIMFLDRLGERQDEELIRTIALRLVAGQTYTGGWSYECPRLKPEQEAELLKGLRAAQDRIVVAKRAPREGAKRHEDKDPPEIAAPLNKLAVFQKPEMLIARAELSAPGGAGIVGGTDNSNTQFATLGLWAARRHDVPVLPTFQLIVRRFECSQAADGTWSYRYRLGGANPGNSGRFLPVTNTGAGLLGLAIGTAELATSREHAEKREKQIVRGLTVLSQVIGDRTNQLAVREYGEPYYYLLWTVERVASLYNLRAIGDQDWYRWGATILLSYQKRGGEWPHLHDDSYMASFSDSLNTAFALLFLKRSNLVKDLTAKLPLKPAELNKGIARLRAGAPPLDATGDNHSRNEKSKR
jgi:hypothetical protein